MQTFKFPSKNKKTILALGAESAGNFSVHIPSPLSKGGAGGGLGGFIYFSENFGDLLNENNWLTFQKAVLSFIKENKIKPDIVLTDLHPLMKTTLWGKELAKKYKAKHIQIQHHHAHLFSSVGEKILKNKNYQLPATSYAAVLDGTGYGTDERIWGGEVFKISKEKTKTLLPLPLSKGETERGFAIQRIGSLENQILLGGELAIKEPARVLLSILNKFLDKKAIYPYMATFYSRNEFELLYNQLEQNFNCLETSSTGRILDAVSLLLGFCGNKRNYKHEAIDLLEKNSTKPYINLHPKFQISNFKFQMNNQIINSKICMLNTTYLFEYLIKSIGKDKKRLAATAQLYIAKGLHEIIKKDMQDTIYKIQDTFFSGGLSENRVIKNYFIYQNLLENKQSSIPKGDAGISFGQIIYFLLQ